MLISFVGTDTEGSVASPVRPTRGGSTRGTSNSLFTSMSFVITFNKNEMNKDPLEKEITRRGGTVLSAGFEEFFDAASIKIPPPGNSVAKRRQSEASDTLVLVKKSLNTGFACVLANTHSRTPKYLQALALGLPCLSTQWVDKCIAEDKIVDWEVSHYSQEFLLQS